MADKTVYQGDSGLSVLTILTHKDGSPIDLTSATSAEFVMVGPDGEHQGAAVIVSPATSGAVRYFLTAGDVDTPGVFEFVIKITYAGGTITYPSTGPLTLEVLPGIGIEYPDLLVTPQEASVFTGSVVDAGDLAKAQMLISIFIDRDLMDDEWVGGLSGMDHYRLMSAICTEADNQHQAKAGSALGVKLPAGATSVTQGDVSISFGSGGASAGTVESLLGTLTLRLLAALSWRNGSTIRPQSMFESTSRIWTMETAFYNPVVRGPLPERAFWEPIN